LYSYFSFVFVGPGESGLDQSGLAAKMVRF
jgi:hypothetical protein